MKNVQKCANFSKSLDKNYNLLYNLINKYNLYNFSLLSLLSLY